MEILKNLKPEVRLTPAAIAKTAAAIEETHPEKIGQVFNHEDKEYTVVGKWWWAQKKYLFQDAEEKYFSALIDAPKVKTAHGTVNQAILDTLEPMNLDIVKLGEIDYNPDMFVPLESETPLDKVFSKKGGLMPATNYIIVGDPGIGKSTLSIEYAAQLQKNNPDKKILFISGEMTRVDMYEYLERFEDWASLNTIFMSEFTEGRYKESIETLFSKGWDCIVLDSFAEINDAVREDYNMNLGGKMSATGAEKWLIDLFIDNNLGKNDEGKYTSFLSIQQVTKGGNFVGSNKLKHNTTGMVELRYTKSGERKIVVSKNRRGFEYSDLHFQFNEEGDPITFDVERIEREKEMFKKSEADRNELLEQEAKFKELFGGESDVADDEVLVEETGVEVIE